MTLDRLARLSPLSGIGAVVALVIGFALMGVTQYFPTPARIEEMISTDPVLFERGTVFIGVYAGFLLLWFTGSVAASLRRREGGDGYLSAIALLGGLLTVVGLATAGAAAWVAAARAIRQPDVDPIHALVLYDFFQNVTAAVVSTGLAAFIGATGLVGLRSKFLPRWFGWASVVTAIGLLTPIHYVFMILAIPWIIYVAVALYRDAGRQRTALADPER